jgi:23S rRNA (adenine2503-C2)-methyltransferase
MDKISFYSLTLFELQELFRQHNLPESGPSLLYNWHYKKKETLPCIDDFAKVSRDFVTKSFDFTLPLPEIVKESQDQTVKFLFTLKDGLKVESVLIPFKDKYTLCLSSQVGCAMKCSFCYTGTQGLKRHLETEEIIGQFISAQRWLSHHRPGKDKILNIVFMGQGEPLHNFDAVKKACEIFLEKRGLCLAPHKITISTAGHLPGLERWKEEMPKVNIAISLHSPIAEKRNQLIPLNQRYPIEDVVNLADAIPEGRTRFVTYEYLLIKDFNDSHEDAHATGKFLAGKNAFISLIPFNPFPGTIYKRPSTTEVEAFKAILDSYKIPTLIRKTKGDEILAACGQLNTRPIPPLPQSPIPD